MRTSRRVFDNINWASSGLVSVGQMSLLSFPFGALLIMFNVLAEVGEWCIIYFLQMVENIEMLGVLQ